MAEAPPRLMDLAGNSRSACKVQKTALQHASNQRPSHSMALDGFTKACTGVKGMLKYCSCLVGEGELTAR